MDGIGWAGTRGEGRQADGDMNHEGKGSMNRRKDSLGLGLAEHG